MGFFSKKMSKFLKPFSGQSRSGSVPLGILAAGVGLAVMTAALVRMGDRLRSVADGQKREAAIQVSQSSVAVFKQLLQSEPGSLPAVFPDPIIRNPGDQSLKLVKNRNLTASTWTLVESGAESELTILNLDSRKADFTGPFSGRSLAAPTSGSKVRVSKVGLSSVSAKVSVVDVLEIAVQVPDPVKKSSKLITSKFRLDVPSVPTPTCSIQAGASGVRLFVDGAAMAARITDQDSGLQIASFDRNRAESGTITADSVFGRGVNLVTSELASLPAAVLNRPGPIAFVGEVSGVGGNSSTCSGTLNRIVRPPLTPVLRRPSPPRIACKLRLIQGALEYWSARVERRPQMIVKLENDSVLDGMPTVVSSGNGPTSSGVWSRVESSFPGCQDPPCYLGVFNDRAVWQPGDFKVSIRETNGGVGECRAFNYGTWDGTWRGGPMAYAEVHVGSGAQAAALQAGIEKVDNADLSPSNTFVYSTETVTRLCALKGLVPYYSDSTGSEKRTNYSSCQNNAHWKINGNQMVKVSGCSANWIGSLICN